MRQREREREKTEEELWDTKENKLKKLNKYEKRGKEIESKMHPYNIKINQLNPPLNSLIWGHLKGTGKKKWRERKRWQSQSNFLVQKHWRIADKDD